MPSLKPRREGKAALPPAARGRERGSRRPPRGGGVAVLPQAGAEMPGQLGGEQVRRGGVWVGTRGPGGRGEMPRSARRRGGTVTAAARAPAPRRSRLPGLAAHPRALPSAQARRWDLQQSLQETPGPVIRQEISALPDGQAGRVRVSALSFPAVGGGAAVAGALKKAAAGGNKAAPAGAGNLLRRRWGGGSPAPQTSAAAGRGSRRSVSRAVSSGVHGGLFGLIRSGIYIYVYIYVCGHIHF